MSPESRYEAYRKFCQMVGSPVMEFGRWLLVSDLVDTAKPQRAVEFYFRDSASKPQPDEARNSA